MSKPNSPFMREIKSFVKREGRLTVGQRRALVELWPIYGREISQGLQTNSKNAVFEIGFGNGDSLLQMAKAEPQTEFIGVEVHRPGVGALLLGIEQFELKNLTAYQADAITVLTECIPDDSLQRVQLFFPDPWPKKKHHKRRIVQSPFIELVRTKLITGGVFHMATDWQPYAEYVVEFMKQVSGFENLAGSDLYSPKPEYRPTTKFENRGKKLGHGVWDMLYRKV